MTRAKARLQPVGPPVRLRSPGDLCQAVPFLLGFEPRSSLVAVAMRGERRRVGVVARVDLPSHRKEAIERGLPMVLEALTRDGADAVALVAYAESDEPDPADVVQATRERCAAAGIEVFEALRVRAGRWTSYLCQDACCPPEGTPIPDRRAAPGVVTTAMTAAGLAVVGDRSEIERSVAPVGGVLGPAMRDRIDAEQQRFIAVAADGELAVRTYRKETVSLVLDSVDIASAGTTLDVDPAARMIVGLADKLARDSCVAGFQHARVTGFEPSGVGPEAIELWRQLVPRAVVPGTRAPVATLLAASAYLDHGNGALANVALEAALRDDPGYTLAIYLLTMLEHGLSPSTVAESASRCSWS